MKPAMYIAYDPEDEWNASRCRDEADLRLCLSNVFENRHHPTIIKLEGDGLWDDVTEEFRPRPDPEEYEPVESWTRLHTRHMRKIGSFGIR